MPIRVLLKENREDVLKIAQRLFETNVHLSGSSARGEARADSDVDLLVQLAPACSLMDQIALKQDLEEMLGCEVDVVVEGGISPYLQDRILAEATPL